MLEIQQVAKNSKHWQKKIYKKFAVSNIRRTFAFGNGDETETESSLIILIAKTQAVMVLRFRFVCRLSLCYIKTAKRV